MNTGGVADLAFAGIVVAFFALAALLVRACERIIGPDEQAVPATEAPDPVQELAA